MSEALGSLCIVLHGHLPFVLHHGSYPHGEAWLFEAAAETYLPILDVIGECALLNARPAITIGLMPVLLEQLAHERFKTGFVDYLTQRSALAERDAREFRQSKQPHFEALAVKWQQWHEDRLAHFLRIGRDIPSEFAKRCMEGHVQILTSNATHAYMPVLLNDRAIRAQLSAGIFTTEKRLGIKPKGIWLPECAYRPETDQWIPAALSGEGRHRVGLEELIADAGITHFFVDTHLITGGQPMGTVSQGRFYTVSEAQMHWETRRGWKDVLEPVGVTSRPEPARCFAFGRHPRVSEQVWSGSIGYPGAGSYLEFHKKHGDRGLRYWRVTDPSVGLGDKEPYVPGEIAGTIHGQAQHFCGIVREVLREYHERTGRKGVCVAPFDAELFGHWWFEGPRFLRDVILTMAHDPDVKLQTAQEVLDEHPPDKTMKLPEGSWGEKGDHSVWVNNQTRWIWEIEYRAEDRLLNLLDHLPWKTNLEVESLLKRAARQLLLMQASDWPFVIYSKGAVDYGIQRFAGHATNFDRATTMAEEATAGEKLSDVRKAELAEMDLHDTIFPDIDLNWWM